MKIERKETGSDVTFILLDDLLSPHINQFSDEMNQFVKNDMRHAILDFSCVRKIDSMAIAAVIRLKNALTERGRSLHLINPNETVLRVLELSGLEKYLLD